MVGWEMEDAVIAYASEACCSTIAIAIQIQGCIICLILALGWALAATVRGKELKRIKDGEKDGNSFAFLYPNINDLEHSAQKRLPKVSVVMPLKGFGEHNYSNWKSQLVSLYGGPLEFLFVVESTDDPAFPVVSQLLLKFKACMLSCVCVRVLKNGFRAGRSNQLMCLHSFHSQTCRYLYLFQFEPSFKFITCQWSLRCSSLFQDVDSIAALSFCYAEAFD